MRNNEVRRISPIYRNQSFERVIGELPASPTYPQPPQPQPKPQPPQPKLQPPQPKHPVNFFALLRTRVRKVATAIRPTH